MALPPSIIMGWTVRSWVLNPLGVYVNYQLKNKKNPLQYQYQPSEKSFIGAFHGFCQFELQAMTTSHKLFWMVCIIISLDKFQMYFSTLNQLCINFRQNRASQIFNTRLCIHVYLPKSTYTNISIYIIFFFLGFRVVPEWSAVILCYFLYSSCTLVFQNPVGVHVSCKAGCP